MVAVPQKQIGEVKNQGIGNARQVINTSPKDFGDNSQELSRVADNVSTLGNQVAQTQQIIQNDINEAAAKDADVRLSGYIREILNQDFYNRRGKDAVAGQAEIESKLLEISDGIASELTNEHQRRMFNDVAQRRLETSLNNVSSHVNRERRSWKIETSNARIADMVDDAVANYTDNKIVNRAIATGEIEILELAELNGWDADVTKQKQEQFRSQIHSSIVSRMVSNEDITNAKQYYETNKSEVEGVQREKIEKTLNVGLSKQKAQINADKIINSTDDYSEQLRQARKISDPNVRDDVVSRINSRHSEQERIRSERIRQAKADAWDVVKQGQGVESIPTEILAELDGTTISSMRKFAKGDPIETDWKSFNQLNSMEPDQLLQVDLNDYLSKLAESEFKTVSNLQRKYAEAKRSDSVGDVATLTQQINAALAVNGIKDDKKEGLFRQAVRTKVASEEKRLGKELSFEEEQKIIGTMLLEGEKKGRVFDADVRFYEVYGTDKETDFFIEDVPDDEKQKIVAAIRRKGLEVTEDKVIELYTRKLLNVGR